MSPKRKKSCPDKPEDSSIAADNEPISGFIRFEVDKISKLDNDFKLSPEVEVSKLFWRAAVRKTEKDGEEFLSLYLIGVEHKSKRRITEMKYDHFLLNSDRSKNIVKRRVKEFNRHHARRGFKFIEWKKLMDEKEGFVKDDKIMAEIRFSILRDVVAMSEGTSTENQKSNAIDNVTEAGPKKKPKLGSKIRIVKKNVPKLGCEECDYTTRSVSAWEYHLRVKHFTTPVLAGLAILCECGKESFSYNHSAECSIGNVSIVRKRDGPIQRLTDKKVTPKCVLCEIYPRTALGYSSHLRIHHNATLKENNIYLKCSCGFKATAEQSMHNNYIHKKECNPRLFTLHKLEEN